MIYKTNFCSVEVVQASQCTYTGQKIITLILEYPRAIHAQLLTHRVFSKNSSSSRAVPAKKAIKQIQENPANYFWTLNQPGMQGKSIEDPMRYQAIQKSYLAARDAMVKVVEHLTDPDGLNVHKQNACRLLEPFQNIRVCLTSTEWENWDWLRIDPDAQGEIQDLAKTIKIARDEANYFMLQNGDWHVPFVKRFRSLDYNTLFYHDSKGNELTLEQAINISMSCAGQTSYRNLDDSLEKAEDIIPKLFNGAKVHASPSEHQATPIGISAYVFHPETDHPQQAWRKGITHMDRDQCYWSGNFRNFIQNRQLLPNHDAAKGLTNDSSN